jgi:hypothetical protein
MDEQKPPDRTRARFLGDPVPPTQRAGLDGKPSHVTPNIKNSTGSGQKPRPDWLGQILHDKILIKIRKIQEAHCIIAGTRINGTNRMAQFVHQLVEISNAQWLYRNFTLHHYAKGTYDCKWSRILEKRWISLRTQGHQTFPPNAAIYLSYHRYPQQLLQQSMTHTGSRHLKRQKQLLPGTKESMHERAPEWDVENPKPLRTF